MKTVRLKHFALLLLLALTSAVAARGADAPLKPNIVYILCDDLGFGDIKALNPDRCKIATPNVDKLVSEGMAFSNAHSGSAVCTPTRYGILTGRYAWRTHLQKGVLGGFSAPLIASGRQTVAEYLKSKGYHTACMGKWHLGMEWPGTDKDRDYAKPIHSGPTEHGFDYYYGIAASLDMPPFIWIENNHTVGKPTAVKKWLRQGPAEPSFEAEDVLPTLARKASEYIKTRAKEADGKPFFLYLPLNAPHTPIVPTKEWQGKSGIGDYGDFVMETDWAAGEIMKAIDEAGIASNTLLIFTSDNGCSPAAGTEKLEAQGHFASGIARGYKADIWEGGHRIPFIARWPGKIKAGEKTAQLTCLTDLFATCAEMLGDKLPETSAEDSVSILPILLGKAADGARTPVIHHSIGGQFAVRKGNWKLELCAGSGGWGKPKDAAALAQKLPAVQLYDMEKDPSETKNVSAENPEVVKELTALIEQYVTDGRSTPGAKQQNDVPVKIIKNPGEKGKAAADKED